MTSLVHKLGLSSNLAFHDVYSLDDPSLLAFVPRPVHALLLVFPVSKTYESARTAEDSPLPDYSGSGAGEEVIWFRQTIANACGMMGLLHSACNGGAKELIGMCITMSSFGSGFGLLIRYTHSLSTRNASCGFDIRSSTTVS